MTTGRIQRKEGSKWDNPIPEYLEIRWKKWRMEVLELSKFKIKRCFKPDNFGEVIETELQHFSGACFYGYGQFHT